MNSSLSLSHYANIWWHSSITHLINNKRNTMDFPYCQWFKRYLWTDFVRCSSVSLLSLNINMPTGLVSRWNANTSKSLWSIFMKKILQLCENYFRGSPKKYLRWAMFLLKLQKISLYLKYECFTGKFVTKLT